MEIAGLTISWRDMMDIGLVALIYYYLISLVRGTRAVPVIYGLVLLLIIYHTSDKLGLYTLNWLLTNFLGSIFLVIIILFQKDIRKALSQVGVARFWRKSPLAEEGLDQIVQAAISMSTRRTGALIVIEKTMGLGDIVEGGVELDAVISKEALLTIFFHDCPLHDGAVVIRSGRITAASCILPLSTSVESGSWMGTRHRAAKGLSEETDAVTLVVSEETGGVSIAVGGEVLPVELMKLSSALKALVKK